MASSWSTTAAASRAILVEMVEDLGICIIWRCRLLISVAAPVLGLLAMVLLYFSIRIGWTPLQSLEESGLNEAKVIGSAVCRIHFGKMKLEKAKIPKKLLDFLMKI